LDWALKNDQLSVWAPSRIVLDAHESPVGAGPLELAAWFAAEFSAQSLVILGDADAKLADSTELDIRTANDPTGI